MGYYVTDTKHASETKDPAKQYKGKFCGTNMLWLVLEAGVALAILIFIVWWTWPRKP